MITAVMLISAEVFIYQMTARVLLHYERKRFAPKENKVIKMKAA